MSEIQPELCTAGPTPGEVAYRGFFTARDSSDAVMAEGWESLRQERRAWWEAAAQAAISADHGTATAARLAAQGAGSIGEVAYCGFTAEKGAQRICWEALDGDERKRWHSAALAVRDLVTRATAAERDQLCALVAEILSTFDPSKGDGYRARVGQVQIAKWRERAGLEG